MEEAGAEGAVAATGITVKTIHTDTKVEGEDRAVGAGGSTRIPMR